MQGNDALCVLRLPQAKQVEAAAAHKVDLEGRDAALAAANERSEGLNANLTAALAKHAVSSHVTGIIQSQGTGLPLLFYPGRLAKLLGQNPETPVYLSKP